MLGDRRAEHDDAGDQVRTALRGQLDDHPAAAVADERDPPALVVRDLLHPAQQPTHHVVGAAQVGTDLAAEGAVAGAPQVPCEGDQ